MLTLRNIFLFAVVVFAISFLAWSSFEYPTHIEVCEVANSTEKCSSHYVPVGVVRWVLFQLDRYGVLLTAIFTGFIAWFTWTLRQSTEKMWIETKKAADAADLSAKAVTIVEFPIVRTSWVGPILMSVDKLPVRGESYGGTRNDGAPTRFSVIAEIGYQNYGRSPAFPVQMQIGFAVVNKLPDIPVFKMKGTPAPSSILKERESGTIETDFGFELSEEERRKISESEAVLWFYILMTYLDIMDRSHEIGSCWQWGKHNAADGLSYFFDNGTAPAAYTKRT